MDSPEILQTRSSEQDEHGRILSNSICSVQSSFSFPSQSSSSKNSLDHLAGLLPSSRDLPKLITKENYLQFSGVSSQPRSVIVENGLFVHSDSNLITRLPESGVEQLAGFELSPGLQPPHSSNGTPMCIKRGPGRPRKDGAPASKCSNSLNKFKKFCSGTGNFVSGSMRGVRGRKKCDGVTTPFVTNSGSLSELGILDHESPMFTEDTMESDSSSVASSFDKLLEDFTFFPEQWPGKVCALCNLGEKSMSGQGELLRMEIPAGFDSQAVYKLILNANEKDSSSDKSPKEGGLRRQKPMGKIKRLASQGSLESTNEPVEEIVGYLDEPDLNTVFDVSTGYYYVHMQCALWCRNVSEGERSSSFLNLEYEILRALSQRCSHCGNLGAGLPCSILPCSSILHLPCAATSGSFQEAASRLNICSNHLDRVVSLVGSSANCTVCDEHSNLSSMIICSTCGHHYHTSCMALTSDSSMRAGWQCPACKVCQACRQPGDEGKLLACETCDKAYHIFCIRPALSSIPKHSWKCKICRICSDCGARTPGSGPSSRWHGNFSICDSCYQQRNKGLACPLCGKAYRHVAQKLMLQCHLCKKFVHGSCDANAELSTYHQRKELYPDYEYICIPCKTAGTGLNTTGCNPRAILAIKKASDKEDLTSSESNSLLSSTFALSQDSLVFMEEDSLAGNESSIDLIWSDKTRTSSLVSEEPPPIQPQQPQKTTPPQPTITLPLQPKKRNGAGRPKSTDKNTSSGEPKKNRMTDIARKRGPKPKMRGVFGAPGVGLQRPSSDTPSKGEEEPGVENRLVLCSSKDEFVLQQDVCVMCGAFGNDLEGRLIACAQCGQCYHPFCVNVKVTKVVLQKGWRCLDCTVCEGCGQRHDEGRLILCDDCDISFHIYCMNPPLDFVPQGNWKCKWCAVCQLCGSNEPGMNSTWHKNYTICGPCNSLETCPVCLVDYTDNELVIQCQTCDRWLHGACDVIVSEEEAEKCAEFGYHCVLCRPREVPPPHLLPPPPVVVKPPPKSPDLQKSRILSHYTLDGVTLSNCGIQHIRSLSLDQPRKKRRKMPNIADMEAGILAAIESVVSGNTDSSEMEDPLKSEDSLKPDDFLDKGKDGKKRGRNLQKFGVGGFVVRLRGPRLKNDDLESESQNGNFESEKPKRKPARRKLKNKLVECFPVYLQEAFFGKSLLEVPLLKEGEGIGATVEGEPEGDPLISRISLQSTIRLSPEELKILEGVSQKKDPMSKVLVKKEEASSLKGTPKKSQTPTVIKIEADETLQDILPLPGDLLDNDLVNTIMNDEMTKNESLDLAVNSGLGDDGELGIEHTENGQKDELTDFLSSIDQGLPSMDSKDVEDIFKGVLTDEEQERTESIFPLTPGIGPPPQQALATVPSTPPTPTPIPSSAILIPPNISPSVAPPPVQGSPGLSRSNSLHSVPQGLASPLNFPPPSPYHSEYSNSPQFSPAFSEPPSPWPAQVEGEVETPGNYSQRSILKWEVDEALGSSATISAVLYANMNHQDLRKEFPNWNERSKQIAKIWRSLPTDKRAPYLQKARENRAACRMQKAQQDQDKLMPSVPVKTTRGETQEERHWKQLQAYRQQQAQAQQSMLQEHRLQGDQKPEHLGISSSLKHPFSSGMQIHRQMSGDMTHIASMDHSRQPLQVTTTANIPDGGNAGSLMSPHLQSPNSRQSFPNPVQPVRMRPPALEMPPPSPSPHYSPKGVMSQQHSPLVSRSPIYSRIPYIQSPRPPLGSPNDSYNNQHPSDPYSHPPSTPRPESDASSPNPEVYQQKILNEQYLQNTLQNTSPNEVDSLGLRSGVPQAQETRQHLRDLLQRQQIKKLEQDHTSPPDMTAPSQRLMSWSPEDWHKVSMEGGNQNVSQTKHNLGSTSPLSQLQSNQFRHPFLPPNIRMGNPNQSAIIQGRPLPTEFRPIGPHSPHQPGQPQVDPRMRVILQHHQPPNQQQQRTIMPQPPLGQSPRSTGFQQQLIHSQQPQQMSGNGGQFQIRTNLGYDQLQGQRFSELGDGNNPGVTSSSMLAQQLGRPLNTGRVIQPQPNSPTVSVACTSTQLIPPSSIGVRVGNEVMGSSEHQELPESVTAELEKLEEEQHNEAGVEGDPGELADLGMDDDELLGMGADFNILEYADPELNQVVGGEKTNILDDNLDLEEEKEEEKRKDELEKDEKKERPGSGGKYGNLPVNSTQESSASFPPSQATVPLPKSDFRQESSPSGDGTGVLLRPPQPPPPYPGPPPPYPGPGRQQTVGIRNGGGLSLQPASPVMNMSMIFKNTGIGGGNTRRPMQQLPTIPSHNAIMSANQRRTLLLQEQPLLLEDLLEQEKREQQRQGPIIINPAAEEPLLSDFDFERLKADVLSSNNLPPSLSPPSIPGQGLLPPPPQQPMYSRLPSVPPVGTGVAPHGHGPPPPDWSTDNSVPHESPIGMHPAMSQLMPNNLNSSIRMHVPSLPAPPLPPDQPTTEQDRQMQIQYEQWLYHQQQILSLQLKYYDGEVAKLRKVKKSLNSKQRQLRKNGSELNENDGMELERVVKELGGIQKQLELARKQTRQHGALIQEYKNKQQKRQQMMGMSQSMGPVPNQVRQNMGPGNQGLQSSPLGNPSHSPLQSTPQSPMLSPSPSMSPLTQHSPMASPMVPSPGPGPNSIVQTSPRGPMGTGLHHMDDRPFSPGNNDVMRPLQSPGGGMMGQQIRMQQGGTQHRMGNMGGGSPQIMSPNVGNLNSQHILPNRGMGMSMVGHQQRPMTFVMGSQSQQQRMRTVTVNEQMRMHGSSQRFPRLGMGQEMMRGRIPMQNFQSSGNQQQSLGKPPGSQQYVNSQRVPFPVQSPTGVGMNMRSPSPLMQIGSPPGSQVMMNQNRVSPASSPMRRRSGSGSVGIGSPVPDRPKSVENPLTPRSSGSGPHTPNNGPHLTNMENISGVSHVMEPSHFGSPDGSMGGGKENPHLQNYNLHNSSSFNIPTSSHGDMGGGGGGGSSQMIPYPCFSWFTGSEKMGLKGGSPFSVVNGETHSPIIHSEETETSVETGVELMSVVSDGAGGMTAGTLGVVNSLGSSPSAGPQGGESQNALLKQLLQNTGCASTSQPPSESVRFSLSTCLPSRTLPNTPIHTSHLSEAATRIPQPTSIPPRPPEVPPPPPTPPPLPRTPSKIESVEPELHPLIQVNNVVKMEESSIKESLPSEVPNPKPVKEQLCFSSTLAETIDVVASDQTALDPALYESRRADDEAKNPKRKHNQTKPRQSLGKESQAPKKRARKGSKMEDYEIYLENLMSQLRQLPPIGIAEPDLGRNYNACGVSGMGDMSKLQNRNYNLYQGDLMGEIGNSKIRGEPDYYSTYPFGEESAERDKRPATTQRGFYNQEFASPLIGLFCDRETSRSRSPSPGRDSDTPDTIVSSSSPEPIYDKNNPYSSLKHIGGDESENRRCSSPVYEILRPIPLRPVPARFDRGSKRLSQSDKENKNMSSEVSFTKSRSGGPLKENGNVTVTLTLSSNAVDDIGGILRNLANILSISSPSGYQILERILTPPSQKYGLYTYRSKDGKEAVDIQSILNGAAKFCRHCDVVVLNNIIRKKPSDFPGVPVSNGKEENSDGTDDFYFCSSTCFMQFSMTHGITITPENKAGAVVKHPSESEQSDVCVLQKDPKLMIEKLSRTTKDILEKSKMGKKKITKVKQEPEGEDGKKWKGIRYKNWTPNSYQSHKYKKPTDKELTELLFRMAITVAPPRMPEDARQCLFCHQLGDSISDGPARLLNLDVDKWVHLNCALWSEEVYETENGALVNAEVALKQSLGLECITCNQKGATVKCFKVRCSSVYHLGCAVKEGCVFYKNKTVYCSAHIPKGEKDNELTTLAVFRRVYIQRDENRQVAAVMHHADQHHLLRVGSLIFLNVGQLLPHQLQNFHTRNYIYPIGYKIVRFYWSMIRINKRCQYVCSIHEADGKPEFRITVEEENEERVIKSASAQDAWHQVLEAVMKLRTSSDSINVFPKFITGEDLFGLTEPAIVKVLESLPGVETLVDYRFKYGRNPLLELPLAINPTGCARSEPKLRTHFKRPHTQRTGSSVRSAYSGFTPMSSHDAACPYSKQFVHSKSSQYRKMKQDWRNNVYLARSKIQGLGLYAARDIEKHTMVIEYIGEIIRSELAELREKRYESQNRGIYMFRVDENRVIDATLCGGLARYINHSCNPNCVAEQVEVERDIRIIIFTNRRICRGEELSYDYKFEFEDDQHKIPCLCGAPNCRQWMN